MIHPERAELEGQHLLEFAESVMPDPLHQPSVPDRVIELTAMAEGNRALDYIQTALIPAVSHLRSGDLSNGIVRAVSGTESIPSLTVEGGGYRFQFEVLAVGSADPVSPAWLHFTEYQFDFGVGEYRMLSYFRTVALLSEEGDAYVWRYVPDQYDGFFLSREWVRLTKRFPPLFPDYIRPYLERIVLRIVDQEQRRRYELARRLASEKAVTRHGQS